ncbi:MAG: ABC transporter permease, partial [Massilibacteroides sp.]|nr:ABC transporter permease [Massilibacteroides sp.]
TEEKTSRIIEILVSSVKPFQLMLGKIIGIGFVGLTQLFLWGIMVFALMGGIGFFFGIDTGIMTASNPMAIAGPMTIQPEASQMISTLSTINWSSILSCFVLFFIGGYLLYSSFFAAVGSAVESQEDTGQFMMPVTLLLVFALYAGIYSIENPDGPLAFWCSLIPLTSPIVMMIRLPFDVPTWQIGLSLVILFGTALGNIWISGRIYRIGILMYGKKSSIKEILKWIRYKGD